MAGGSVLSCSRKIMIFLVIYFLMTQLKPHIQADNHLGHILVGSNLDVKPIYSRNSGPRHVYSKADKLPSTCKVSKLLNLTESSLLVLSFILLAGDINPQPGPANVLDVPTLDFKARGLSVLHLNVRSLLGKMDQLRLLCEHNGADIITLSETWLNKDIDDSEIELPGYSIIRRDRSERTGGGVIIYIHEGLVFSETNDLHNNNEAIWIQVNQTCCKPLIIRRIYRPPNQQVETFLEDFNNSLAGIESHFDKIILGDFNIDYSSKKKRNANQPDRRKLKGIEDLHDIRHIIDFPTRIAEHSESQIDLIFTDNVHKIADFGVKDFGISDHSMVYCVFKSGLMKVPPKTLQYRSFKSYNKSSFRQDLTNVPWHVALNNPEDLEGCVQTWYKLFLQGAEDHAPTKTCRVRGTATPWMTSEIATLMRDRNYHLKKTKGNKTYFHWKQYCALRNKVQCKIKKSKSEYYCNLIKDSRNNPSDLWKSVKEAIPGSNPRKDNVTSLRSDGITHTNPTSMSSNLLRNLQRRTL